ncbi:MAG: hypothetical protein E3K37_03510 [Candidatus Kuenenia sp.]|nr:hypothetical protein [Candidatus Kuenenia hertensis]
MGCTLHITEKDYHQIKSSIKSSTSSTQATKILKAFKDRAQSLGLQNETLEYLLKLPQINSKHLIRALGNSKLSDKYAKALPNALKNIACKNKRALNVFNHIKDNSWKLETVNSLAYKIVAISQLLSNPNNNLFLRSGDIFSIGSHLSSQYPADAMTTILETFLFTPEEPKQPDIIIHRGERNIGVDFKYRQAGSSCGISNTKLEVIADKIMSGSIHEYHIVTNNQFTSETKEAICELNKELEEKGKNTIEIHEYIDVS